MWNMSGLQRHLRQSLIYDAYFEGEERFKYKTDTTHYFFDRGLLLTRKPLNQVFIEVKLKSSLRKFYGRHHDLVIRYVISVSQMLTDIFHNPVCSSFMTHHRVCNNRITTCGAGTAYLSGAPEWTSVVSGALLLVI